MGAIAFLPCLRGFPGESVATVRQDAGLDGRLARSIGAHSSSQEGFPPQDV